jgi:hypothetical protein
LKDHLDKRKNILLKLKQFKDRKKK